MKSPLPCRLAMVLATGLLILSTAVLGFARPPFLSPQQQNPSDTTQKAEVSTPAPLTLSEHFTLTRDMRGGDSHEFRFALEEGQFLKLRVLQEGIDVEVHLLDPSGNEITSSDSLNGDNGPETVAAIVKDPGEYRLKIACGNPKAVPGHYQLQVIGLHLATLQDIEDAAAEQSFAKGMQLLNSNSNTSETRGDNRKF